jgi:hypothetical protein
VTAELLGEPEAGTDFVRTEGAGRRHTPAPVRWTAADGSVRVASVGVPASFHAGEHARFWVDRAERVVGPPIGPREPDSQERL